MFMHLATRIGVDVGRERDLGRRRRGRRREKEADDEEETRSWGVSV
jgi:hypothetical protein